MSCEIKTCRLCGGDKPHADFHSGRATCKTCVSDQRKQYRDENSESIAKYRREYYAANREKSLSEGANWRSRNPDKVKESSRIGNSKRHWKTASNIAKKAAWIERNRESLREYTRAWKRINASKINMQTASRRAKKKCATVGWSDGFMVAEMYDLAKSRTQATGFAWHVDHIVPLRSEIVCGLHAHTNLRVIPALKNMEKSNRVWPGMPQ